MNIKSKAKTMENELPAFPWYFSSRTTGYLWLSLILFVMGGGSIFFVRVPIHVTGEGVTLSPVDIEPQSSKVPLVIFLPPENLPDLKAGQPVLIQDNQSHAQIRSSLLAIEKEPVGYEKAQQQYASAVTVIQRVLNPTAVAFTEIDPAAIGEKPSEIVGKRFRVDVKIGSRRIGAFLPVIGSMFKGDLQ
jgi:hypothetical protein